MEQANKRVAEDGIAQVSDVGGLVGVNTGVLDQNLACWDIDLRFFVGSESGGKLFALDPRIDVASPGKLQPLKTMDRADAATISSAIFLGGLRNFLASSKASGRAYSPSSTRGGCSITIFGKSRS